MKNPNRNVEDDIRGLLKVFRRTFDRNESEIPKYTGQECEQKFIDRPFNIKSNLNGKGYEYHIEEGRKLEDILLSSAYQLGYDLCQVTKVEGMSAIISMFNSVNSDRLSDIRNSHSSTSVADTSDGVTIGIIDAILTLLKVLKGRDFSSMDVNDAMKDLKENEDLKDLLKLESYQNF